MKKLYLSTALLSFLIGCTTISSEGSKDSTPRITQEQAKQIALSQLTDQAQILGIRFDEPDLQWDVFVQSDDKAFEIEINAVNGEIFAIEEETLAEIQAELSGNLSHEGVEGDID